MLRVLYCGTGWRDAVPTFAAALTAHDVAAEVRLRDDARPLLDQLADVHVALPSNAPFGAREIAAAPRLRLVQQPAVGYEGIDLAAARARDIPVCNAPGANADAVAQAALLLVLSLARRVHAARRAFERAEIGAPVGFELTGRTLGIVGRGRSGTQLALAAHALGMTVTSVGRADGRAGLHALLARSDVVSLHCPLNDATRGLLDDAALASLRPGALLVNAARGGLIDRGALERALHRGALGGVGLDVFWEEPWDPRDPLFARDDVVVLPHIAGATVEAFARVGAVIAANARALLDGGALVHRVA